jgi:hypothetical protein
MPSLQRAPLLRAATFISAVLVSVGFIYALEVIEPHSNPLRYHALFETAGHLMTALVVALGIKAMRLPIPTWSILAGGLLPDLGYILVVADVLPSVEGSSRNGSHALAPIVLVASVGFVHQTRAGIWLGVAIGALSHVWRDMGTGTVPLMWPLTDTVYGTSFNRYLAVLAGMALAMIGSATLLAIQAKAREPERRSPYEGPTSHASGWET